MLVRASASSPFLPITSVQALHYQWITHSFAQRQRAIPSVLNSFRTLSIATGVGTPPLILRRSGIPESIFISFVPIPLQIPSPAPLLFSHPYKTPEVPPPNPSLQAALP